MPDPRTRCVSLKDWQSRALNAGASVLVLPVKPQVNPFAERIVPTKADSHEWVVVNSGGMGYCIKAFISPGEILVGREAWCWNGEIGTSGAFYRADWGEHDYGPRWRSPQAMPAALARHRKLTTSVEAMLVREVPESVLMAMLFLRPTLDFHLTRRQQFEEQWEKDHGPGSLDWWGWVVRMEEER